MCNNTACPVDGHWTSWSTNGPCSQTCGDGLSHRYRTCTNPAPSHGGAMCSGWGSSSIVCNQGACQVDGHWTSWSTNGPCSQTCGDGLSYRYRTCTNPAPSHGGAWCSGLKRTSVVCNLGACPANNTLGNWTPFGPCSRTCGPGVKTRHLFCNNQPHNNGSYGCPGTTTTNHSVSCNTGPCPVDGHWSAWSQYSHCTATCGNYGSHTRYRTCTNPVPSNGGASCQGVSDDQAACNRVSCSGDMNAALGPTWGEWSSYGDCSCRSGLRTRHRSCNSPHSHHEKSGCTGDSKQSETCERHHCESHHVDGQWGTWSAYGACSRTCGTGIFTRYRTCTRPVPFNGGAPCIGQNRQSAVCHIRKCPVDGHWTPWSVYNPCSKTCGGGIKRRYRTCTDPAPAHGGVTCRGSDHQAQHCNRQDCPVDGSWATWTRYGACSVSCGSGVRARTRTCTNPAPSHGGVPCQGTGLQNVTCDKRKCPVDGGWSRWSGYGHCSASCGTGIRTRHRACTDPAPSHGGASCRGIDQQTTPCHKDDCPFDGHWSPWSRFSPCTQSCGLGTHTRQRHCKSPAHYRSKVSCKGSAVEIAPCRLKACQGHRG